MSDPGVGEMAPDEFEALIGSFIGEGSQDRSTMPYDAFFELLQRFDSSPVVVKGHVSEGHIVLVAPPESGLHAEGNRVVWPDGHELVIELEYAQPAAAD